MNNPLGLVLKILCILLIKVMKFTVNALFFLLPVGVYILIMQFANKMSAMTSLSSYTEEKSEWMFIYPNTIMVTVNPNLYKTEIKKAEKTLNSFIEKHKYTLLAVFCVILLCVIAFCK